MYYGVIGKSMEIAITDILEVGQLIVSREWDDRDLFSRKGEGRRGLIIDIKEVDDGRVRHAVKILWQDTGEIEGMPDWYAAELLEPMPS